MTGSLAYELRTARASDAHAIGDLLMTMGHAGEPDYLAQRVAHCKASPDDQVLVVDCGDGHQTDITGLAVLHASWLFHEPGRIGRVKLLGVHPDHQRSGMGTALMDAACEFFVTRGCIRMEVTSPEYRAGAHAFYLGYGLQASFRRFVLDFQTSGQPGPERRRSVKSL